MPFLRLVSFAVGAASAVVTAHALVELPLEAAHGRHVAILDATEAAMTQQITALAGAVAATAAPGARQALRREGE